MRPWRSNTPAERSPASRTEVENAVRSIVCACSSTTAIRRLHMIWVWICANAAFGRATMAFILSLRARYEQRHCEERSDEAIQGECVVAPGSLRRPRRPPRHGALEKTLIEIPPLRISPLNEGELPLSRSSLDLLLARDRCGHIVILFIPN